MLPWIEAVAARAVDHAATPIRTKNNAPDDVSTLPRLAYPLPSCGKRNAGEGGSAMTTAFRGCLVVALAPWKAFPAQELEEGTKPGSAS